MEENLHDRILKGGIQHCDQYKQNEGYNLRIHGNKEEVMRQNSNAFPLPEEGNQTPQCSWFMSNKQEQEWY